MWFATSGRSGRFRRRVSKRNKSFISFTIVVIFIWIYVYIRRRTSHINRNSVESSDRSPPLIGIGSSGALGFKLPDVVPSSPDDSPREPLGVDGIAKAVRIRVGQSIPYLLWVTTEGVQRLNGSYNLRFPAGLVTAQGVKLSDGCGAFGTIQCCGCACGCCCGTYCAVCSRGGIDAVWAALFSRLPGAVNKKAVEAIDLPRDGVIADDSHHYQVASNMWWLLPVARLPAVTTASPLLSSEGYLDNHASTSADWAAKVDAAASSYDHTTFTFFACPKPFSNRSGPIAISQINAIRSWALLRPPPDIILFGTATDCAGLDVLAAAAQPFARRVRVITDIPAVVFPNSAPVPTVGSLFNRAMAEAVTNALVFSNADIITPPAYADVLLTAANLTATFFMLSPRYPLNITGEIDFSRSSGRSHEESMDRGDWDAKLFGACEYSKCPTDNLRAMDIMAFTRGAFAGLRIPEFAVGRPVYDNWLVHHAQWNSVPIISTMHVVRVIHQNHDYSHLGTSALSKDASTIWTYSARDKHLFTSEGNSLNRKILESQPARQGWLDAVKRRAPWETDGHQLSNNFAIARADVIFPLEDSLRCAAITKYRLFVSTDPESPCSVPFVIARTVRNVWVEKPLRSLSFRCRSIEDVKHHMPHYVKISTSLQSSRSVTEVDTSDTRNWCVLGVLSNPRRILEDI